MKLGRAQLAKTGRWTAGMWMLGASTSALAQFAAPPARTVIDQNRVELSSGTYSAPDAQIDIGSTGAPSLVYRNGSSRYLDHFMYVDDYSYFTTPPNYITVVLGRTSKLFGKSGGAFLPNAFDGSTISLSGGVYTYKAYDGTILTFSRLAPTASPFYLISAVAYPDGRQVQFHYRLEPYAGGTTFRLQSISSSDGYLQKFIYENNAVLSGAPFNNIVAVKLYNTSLVYCDPNADACAASAQMWPALNISATTVSGIETRVITDTALGQATYKSDMNNGGKVISYSKPLGSPLNSSVTYNSQAEVATVTRPGNTYNYSWSLTGPSGAQTRNGTMSDPAGILHVTATEINFPSVKSDTDALSRMTTNLYDIYWRLSRQTLPEGNYTAYTYDGRGNVTEARRVAKPGSGVTDIVTSATYPATCSNPVTCNKPVTTKDELGGVTEYSYDSVHGGMLTVTRPAAPDGSRPQTRYGYTLLYPKMLNAGGTLVNSTPIWKLASVSECSTAGASNPASCVGSSAEKVTTYTYANDNLLKTSETVAAGNGSIVLTTSFGYDHVGNVVFVDGPTPGAGDVAYKTYDGMRRPIFEIGVDPDAGGPAPRQITKHVYDTDGREIRTEYGTGTSTSGSDFVVLRFKRMTFDPVSGNLIKVEEGNP